MNAVLAEALPATLLTLAFRVRHVVEEATVDVEGVESDLGGACAIASRALVGAIRREGGRAEFVYGVYHHHCPRVGRLGHPYVMTHNIEHCWVETSGLIVDLTATQFSSAFDDVHLRPICAAEYEVWRRGAAALRYINEEWGGFGDDAECQCRIRTILRQTVSK